MDHETREQLNEIREMIAENKRTLRQLEQCQPSPPSAARESALKTHRKSRGDVFKRLRKHAGLSVKDVASLIWPNNPDGRVADVSDFERGNMDVDNEVLRFLFWAVTKTDISYTLGLAADNLRMKYQLDELRSAYAMMKSALHEISALSEVGNENAEHLATIAENAIADVDSISLTSDYRPTPQEDNSQEDNSDE